MAYRADIEIAVKGAQELKRLQNEINSTSKLVKSLNDYIENFSGTGIVRSINTLRTAVASAALEFNKVALGTEEAVIAARKYVSATNELNAELKERAALLKTINEEERKNRLARAGIRESTQYGGPIGPGPASPVGSLVGQKSPVEERIKRIVAGRKDQLELEQALLRLEEKSASIANAELQTRGQIAAVTARSVNAAKYAAGQQQGALALPAFRERGLQLLNNSVKLNESNLQIERALNGERARGVRYLEKQSAEEARQVQLGILGQRTNRLPGAGGGIPGRFSSDGPMNLGGGRGQSMLPGSQGAARGALGAGLKGRVPGAVSSAIIGGGFPLLFGQGAAAAAGGGLGGLAGGLLGGGFGFALSIAGTAIGDIVGQAQKIKQLGTDIGFSAQQAETLANAFKKANTDAEKFTAVVQNIRGLGLELEDQAELIKLTTSLTEKYGGQFDKVGNAITSALESGKVSQGTLNQLTSQGVNIQQALADKLRVSKDQLLEMAKKGKIDIQDLVDVLVDMGNKGVEATKKPASGMDQLGKAVQGLSTALGDLGAAIMKALKPALDWLAGALAGIIGLATRAINAMANMLSGGTAETALANARARKQLFEETGGAAPMRGNLTVKQQQRLSVLEKQQQEKIITPDSKVKPIDVSSLGRAPGSGGGGTDKAAKAAAREAARVLEVLRDQRLITIELERQSDYSKKIFAAELAKDPILARRLQGEQQLEEIAIETAGKLEKEVNMQAKLAILGAQEAKAALAYQETTQAIALLEQQRRENAENTIRGFQQELDLKNATTEAERNRLQIMYEMDALRRGGGYNETELQQIEALKKQIAAPETAGEIIQKRIGALQDELLKLTNIGNIAVTVADSIGAAFSQAFQGIISGTMTAQEALASFFQSVGDAFIQMATEIIAKQITMIILQTILKALGGAGGGGGSTDSVSNFNLGAAQYGGGLAGGGPTRGGTPYLVGERGPELFVPGTNGGVMSNSDLRSSMGAAPGSAGGSPVLNMSFETSTINGVEYVSRDQLEAAMAQTRRQAARDGASRGMSMTLDKLQQSPSTRKRVGF